MIAAVLLIPIAAAAPRKGTVGMGNAAAAAAAAASKVGSSSDMCTTAGNDGAPVSSGLTRGMMVGWMDGWIANRLGENSCRFSDNYVQVSYNLHDIYLPLFSKSLDLGSEQPLFQEIWQAIGRGPRRSPISKICPDPSPTRPAKFVSPFRAPDSELSLI